MERHDVDPDAFIDHASSRACVPAGRPFDAWRLHTLTQEQFGRLAASPEHLSAQQLAYLASYGLLAPTTHNTAPQRYRLRPDENCIEVWLDRQFVLAESDPTGRQAIISLGCGISNLIHAAGCYQLVASVDCFPADIGQTGPYAPDEPRYVPVARVRFQPGSGHIPDVAWLRAMLERKVLRAEYDEAVALEEAVAVDLQGWMHARYPRLTLHLIRDRGTLLFLGKFQEQADTIVCNRPPFARELGEWLLENDDADRPNGMRGREFGLDDGLARRLHRGLRGELRLLPDEIAGFARAGNLGMRSSPAVAIITAGEDSIEHRLLAGRAYEDLALLLHRHGFATAVHAGMTEVEAPRLALQGRLRTVQRPMMVFRIGKPLREQDRHRPHSARPSIRDVLLPERIADISSHRALAVL